MNVVFRVDASLQIGSGHLMRCLTLAERLHERENANVVFVSRDLEGNLIEFVKCKGYRVLMLPRILEARKDLFGYEAWLTVDKKTDAEECIEILQGELHPDFLIVDSYAIDEVWERMVRPYVGEIVVIDDLANRVHDCDVLLDQNFYRDKETRYEKLVPRSCRCFLGPRYVLLRKEFYNTKKKLRRRSGKIDNILVFYGGVDLTNETEKAIFAILKSGIKAHVNVILGQSNPYRDRIKGLCDKYKNIEIHCQIDNISTYMNDADLSLGGGGTAIWERYFLELPTLVTSIADNQVKSCESCGLAGYIWYLGKAEDVSEEMLVRALSKIASTNMILEFQKQCKVSSLYGDLTNRNDMPSDPMERCFLA
ncbi:UDP-2,4-diacetamido-2,4,6-trideoxy-beta-L-altropyranose hydrolase [uncultured Selenomonas sp.]|uniref:UDP-2,4-diacetamido-2,4, 6-trideoxy-beta-L-altropyranose hydrolase n=1 Tax=uncultured Selenomonas sp. TaxID=159275 RepID=UPI0028DBC6C9|nr:UDP-2,4-diacetamido-2,4,6-trideoxy-beta-L-altropyranose hydrolase [uncultured Selenomonas sp.]